MKDYSAISDFEINLEVAKVVIGAVWFLEKSPRSDNAVLVTNHMGSGDRDFDPCNYWNDAGPIVEGNRINLTTDTSQHGKYRWWKASSDNGEYSVNYVDRPLRAAMIVFLMMQERE